MVKRKGKHGEFYGCTNYPYCNNTLEIYEKNERIAYQKSFNQKFEKTKKEKNKEKIKNRNI